MTEHPLLILMLSQLSWAQMTSSTCEETLKLKYVTISILGQYLQNKLHWKNCRPNLK